MVVEGVRSAARRVEHAIGWVCKAAAWATLPPLIGITIYDVVGRQFYNTGSTRLMELEWHLFLALFLCSMAYAYVRNVHVRIDVLRDRMSVRTRALVEAIGFALALVPFCLVTIKYGSEFAWVSWATNEGSRSALGLPMRWLIKGALPLGAALLLLAGAAVFVRNVIFLLNGEQRCAPDDGAGEGAAHGA
jgi:TRAP-type mannitol/chloroaromatic compound transport system permease small subunit